MAHLTYGTFVWPTDPERFQVSWQRKPVYAKNSAGAMAYSHMGGALCQISGSGVFWGDHAWDSYHALEALTGAAAAAALQHPQWGSCQAYLTELELTQEPKPGFLRYRFLFTRADDQGNIPVP